VTQPTNPVRVTTRLWSEEVRLADAGEGVLDQRDPAYQFSNGRRFIETNPYAPPDVPEETP
jgi:hypothetical protein